MKPDDYRDVLSILAGPGPDICTTRPVIMGTHGMVASGHYLASRIGLHILEEGGNAVDAGVATGFALAVLEPYIYGIGGEVPILLYLADEKRVVCLSGQGPAPRGASIEWFRKEGIDSIPGDGLLAAAVPDAVSTWIFALSRYGTMRLAQILDPVIEIAERGFPMFDRLRSALEHSSEQFHETWPSSVRAYLPGGRVPDVGEIYAQRDLGRMYARLAEAEHRERRRGRREALQAAHDAFYKGDIAERIVNFIHENRFPDSTGKRNGGLLAKEDLASYATRVEEPVAANYRGYDVFKCGPWSQGPVFLQQLRILEGYDLASMEHNSPEYIHLLIETAKLAFADRETYYGDPDFGAVPLERLLSREYADARRKLIDPERASMELRPGFAPACAPREKEGGLAIHKGDTTHLDTADRWGNLMSATPSGGWFRSSPVIEGLGFPLGTRMQMFSLDPGHPNALRPGKRPRTTLTPSLALRGGRPFMAFGTPGADQQDQWSLQFFLNCVDFGMNMQVAVDAPTFHSTHFPSSFHPHGADPGAMHVESRIPDPVIAALQEKGHTVRIDKEWSHGRVSGIRFDADSGVLYGVVTARLETGYAMGW
ncbi:MAG: gamma-glutamyltransferase family protein [Deltaproteobacteria bacterium]|nr:gamma-glutamyltransferase family protein [Deltaproteobacteria bacterium]